MNRSTIVARTAGESGGRGTVPPARTRLGYPHRVIGNRIRELRQSRKMTVRDLASHAGVSTGLVSQVERGLTDPSLETLRRLSSALGLPLFDLFRQDDPDDAALVRRDRRILVRSPQGGVEYTRVSAAQHASKYLRAHWSRAGRPRRSATATPRRSAWWC